MKSIQERFGFARVVIAVAVVFVVITVKRHYAASRANDAADTAKLAGNWSGDSVCVDKQSACHDEKVVYRISVHAGDSSTVTIEGDKIVDGKPVTMGTSDYHYDTVKGVLTHEDQYGSWVLVVTGNMMDGTMTVSGNKLFRRLTLKKGA